VAIRNEDKQSEGNLHTEENEEEIDKKKETNGSVVKNSPSNKLAMESS
jgi:hypothetical protein